MRFYIAFASLAAVLATLTSCDTPRDISYIRASDLDNSGRYKEAAAQYRFVAQSQDYSGRQVAAFRLADMHFKGEGVEKNPAEGLRLMAQAAHGPDASWRNLANYRLGDLHENGVPGYLERDRLAALRHFTAALSDGNKFAGERIDDLKQFPDVIVELNKSEFLTRPNRPSPGGMELAYELFETSKFKEALPLFTFHAKNGSSEAQYALALMYRNGWGVPVDENRFKGWCFLAARNGQRAAQRELGRSFFRDDKLASGAAEAERWLTRSADQGDVEAVRLLALVALSPPDKSPPNLRLALDRLETAAARGSTQAMVNLGDLYSGKLGVQRDAGKARAYYTAAADAGDREARNRLFTEFNVVHEGKTPGKAGTQPTPNTAAALPPDRSVASIVRPGLTASPPKPSLVDLFATLSPSVVRIITLNIDDKTNEFTGLGSAVVIRPDLLLTNCHVLYDSNVAGTTINKRVLIFDIIGGDKNRDLCLMRPEKPMQSIQKMRSFNSLRVGEKVIAIGSPQGLENSISEGIISGLRRDKGIRYIQTTAALSEGSSGGGLFDENGALIGITTFKHPDGENLNFAVAIDESERVIAHFLKR